VRIAIGQINLTVGDLEGNAGAGGRLFKNHRQRSVLQQFGRAALLIGGFNHAGQFNHVEQFLFGEVLRVNEMAEGHGIFSFPD